MDVGVRGGWRRRLRLRLVARTVEEIQVELARTELSESAELLCDLGIRLHARFQITAFLDDLNRAVSAMQRAVELAPDSSLSQAERLDRLGEFLFERYRRLGVLDDLDHAITALRRGKN